MQIEESTRNLKSAKNRREWARFGSHIIRDVIQRTDLREVKWKIVLDKVHDAPGVNATEIVRVRDRNAAQRKYLLRISPRRSPSTYDLDLCFTHNIDWLEVQAKLNLAIAGINSEAANSKYVHPESISKSSNADENENEEEDFDGDISGSTPSTGDAVVNKNTNGHVNGTPVAKTILGGIDTDRLYKMRAGIDNLLNAGKDIAAAEELKKDALMALKKQKAITDPLHAALQKATQLRDDVTKQHERAKAMRQAHENQLKEAAATEDRLFNEIQTVNKKLAEAEAAYKPEAEKMLEVEAAFENAEKMEQDRMSTLGKVDDMAVFLAALQKLG